MVILKVKSTVNCKNQESIKIMHLSLNKTILSYAKRKPSVPAEMYRTQIMNTLFIFQ